MDPFSIAMLVFSVIATIASAAMQQYSNEQNREIADQNLQAAEENREDSQQFAREQQATANANTISLYHMLDSPAAKVKQLNKAGLSVGLMYGQGGTGGGAHTSAMAGTPSSAPGANLPFINPLLNLATNPVESMSAAARAQNENADTGKKEAETENIRTLTEKAKAEIAETYTNIELLEAKIGTEVVTKQLRGAEAKNKELDNKYLEKTMQDRCDTINQELHNLMDVAQNLEAENDLLQTEKKWRDKTLEQTYKNLCNQGKLILADKALKEAQKLETVSKQALNNAQALTEEAKKAWTEAQTKIADIQERIQGLIEEMQQKDLDNYWLNKAIDIAGALSGVATSVSRFKAPTTGF